MEGNVELERLVVSKVLRKPVNKYRSMFPHVVAAMQMRMRRGEIVDFVYVNASHTKDSKSIGFRSRTKDFMVSYTGAAPLDKRNTHP